MKIIFLLLAFVLIFCGCEKTPVPAETESSVSKIEESSEIVPEEEPKEELFNVSIAPDVNFADASLETISENYSPILLSPEDVIMSEEYQKVYDTFIGGTGYLLSEEFSEDYIPYTYLTNVYGTCERKDFELLGIPKSDHGMDESFWLSSAEVEERLGRYFLWEKEDIRNAFGYDPETDQYPIPAGGGGPMFTYITNVEKDEDILRIYYSFYHDTTVYEGIENPEYFLVYRKAVLEIEQGNTLWKYKSNKIIYDSDIATWHNSDYSYAANISDFSSGIKAEYDLIKNSSVNKLTVFGRVNHRFYMNQTPCGIFETPGGVWIYDFDNEELKKIAKLPSKYNEKHQVTYVGRDRENRIVIAYQCVSDDEYSQNIELAVLDYETLEVINYIDTEHTRGPNFSMGIDRDRKDYFVISYSDVEKEIFINYLE